MENIENIIKSVADSTKSAISKTARSVRQSDPNPELVVSLSRLVDSFTRLIVERSVLTSPGEQNYYDVMEKACLQEQAEHLKTQKLKKRQVTHDK